MANTLQSKKRVRRNARREAMNKSRRARIRTFIKNVESAIDSGNAKQADEAFRQAEPEIKRAAAKGAIHKNAAARTVGRLASRVNSLRG